MPSSGVLTAEGGTTGRDTQAQALPLSAPAPGPGPGACQSRPRVLPPGVGRPPSTLRRGHRARRHGSLVGWLIHGPLAGPRCRCGRRCSGTPGTQNSERPRCRYSQGDAAPRAAIPPPPAWGWSEQAGRVQLVRPQARPGLASSAPPPTAAAPAPKQTSQTALSDPPNVVEIRPKARRWAGRARKAVAFPYATFYRPSLD